MTQNTLYYGDNLPILRQYIPDESVDLIYLDPPFNSNRDYNVIFDTESTNSRIESQMMAFQDTWHWTDQTNYALDDLSEHAPRKLINMVQNFIDILGRNDMTAYIVMLAARLVELHRILKPTGTLFLHCDPSAGHYIKIIMDAIFGDRLINQISWKRSTAHSDAKQGAKHLGRITDLIFWYAKSDTWTHNVQYTPYDEDYVNEFYKEVEEGTGRRYALDNLTGPGGKKKGNPSYEVMGITRYWRYSQDKMNALIQAGRIVQKSPGSVPRYKRYLDEMPGLSLQDMWSDIKPLQSRSKESLGYPTQKPVALLERIIKMASNPGDVVLDPFCGCGTTIAAAQSLNRTWIGIDIGQIAIEITRKRIENIFYQFHCVSPLHEAVQ